MARVVVLVDMDCFYCQVEERLNPTLKGKPMAVVQYNAWKGGGIIAVNYEARDRGVTRHMRGHEAKQHCPEITLVTVPTVRDKADLTRYRDAGREVVRVLCTFSDCVERASVDEAYIDLTSRVVARIKEMGDILPCEKLQNTFVLGYSIQGTTDEEERCKGVQKWLDDIYCSGLEDIPSRKLAVGAAIVEEMRQAVYDTTGFRCSAGIAHNKILAKLACGTHKPNRQTILPQASVKELFSTLPVHRVRNLGGKLGEEIEEGLGCKFMGDLLRFSEKELKNKFEEKTGTWLYNIARGYDYEEVTPRLVSKSIGCCKKFPGPTALASRKDVEHWLSKLAEELLERLLEDEVMYKRRAMQMVVSLRVDKKDAPNSKSLPLPSYSHEKIFSQAFTCLKKICSEDPLTQNWSPPIKYLGLSAGKFADSGGNTINNFFKKAETLQYSNKENKMIGNKAASTDNKVLGIPLFKDVSSNFATTKQTEDFFQKQLKENVGGPSFFEKMLIKGLPQSEQPPKLNLVPGLPKNEPFLDSDDSQSNSCFNFPTYENKKEDIPKEPKDSVVKKNKIHDFFSGGCEISRGKNDTQNKVEIKNSILNFFKDNRNACPSPEDVFPDLNAIDEETLSLFPVSFQKRVNNIRNKCTSDPKYSPNLIQPSLLPSINTQWQEPIAGPSGVLYTKKDVKECSDKSIGTNVLRETFNSSQDIFEEDVPKNDEQEVVPIHCQEENFGTRRCEECGESVLLLTYSEHIDFHIASKLQKELNSAVIVPPVRVINRQASPKKNVQNKRKIRPADSKSQISTKKKVRSIDSFFSR